MSNNPENYSETSCAQDANFKTMSVMETYSLLESSAMPLEKTRLENLSTNNNQTELSEEDFTFLAESYPEELLTAGEPMGPLEKRRLVREARRAGKKNPRRHGRKGKGRKRQGKKEEEDKDATVELKLAEQKAPPVCITKEANKTVRTPRPSQSDVQLWSPMSKKGDGYLKVVSRKKAKVAKRSNGDKLSAYKLQADGKMDTPGTRFRWTVTEMDVDCNTGELMDRVSIKVSGEHIDSSLMDKTFTVCLHDRQYIAVEDDPKTGNPDPEVIPEEDCVFLCGYEEVLGWHITLKDSKHKLLGCDGQGKTKQLDETGNWPDHYPQPGSLFYLTELSKY